VYQVNAASVEWNPPPARLRELTEEMPNSQVTEFGNVAVKARVDSRSTRSTFVVDDSTNATKQTITRDEYARVAAEQDAYLAETDLVVIDGYIGSDPSFRTRARLIMESAHAPVGMCFMPVSDPKTVKNRVHLDITTDAGDRDAEIERLLALGARRVDVGQTGEESWTVLADPEGNEFCVIRPKATLID
jgi:ATP-dependent phosphoenolpyruvate carboxykinase